MEIQFESKKDLEKWIGILYEENKISTPEIPYDFWTIQIELMARNKLDLK